MPPGQYKFRVIACNNDGNWATDGAEMPLVFARYFWQSWWIIGIAAIGLLSTVGGTVPA